jgi:hypothetical protein
VTVFRVVLIFATALTITVVSARPTRAASVSPGCAGYQSGVTATYNATFTATGPFYVSETLVINVFTATTFSLWTGGVIVIPPSPTPGNFSYTWTSNAANFQFLAGANFNATVRCIPVDEGDSGSGITRALDDRLDRRWGMPLASYCRYDGFHFYLIDDASKGVLRLIVTPEAIAVVSEQPAQNTLIARSAENIRLYRLTSGEFQVNYGPNPNGDEYSWAWTTCVPDEGTDHSFNIYQIPIEPLAG